MTKQQILILLVLAAIMVGIAILMGRWSEQINPDGILPHPTPPGASQEQSIEPRDAFSFGVSMGLLGSALLYFCLSAGLMIQSRSKGKTISQFIFCMAGLAALGFVLSYLIDDFFY